MVLDAGGAARAVGSAAGLACTFIYRHDLFLRLCEITVEGRPGSGGESQRSAIYVTTLARVGILRQLATFCHVQSRG